MGESHGICLEPIRVPNPLGRDSLGLNVQQFVRQQCLPGVGSAPGTDLPASDDQESPFDDNYNAFVQAQTARDDTRSSLVQQQTATDWATSQTNEGGDFGEDWLSGALDDVYPDHPSASIASTDHSHGSQVVQPGTGIGTTTVPPDGNWGYFCA